MTFQHRAGVRAYTASCDFARSCVFSKQSLGPGICDPIELRTYVLHPTGAFLLPKLRNHFAEFLNQSFLARLSILYLSTCVGLGYGYQTNSLEAFLGGMGVQWLRLTRLGIAPRLKEARIYLGLNLHAYPRSTSAWVHLPFRVTPLLTYYTLGR